MKYVSTRGETRPSSFEEAIVNGFAPDGGYYVPMSVPKISLDTLESWISLDYPSLAFEVCRLYIDEDEVSSDVLRHLLVKCFRRFTHPEVVCMKDICVKQVLGESFNRSDWSLHLLELFHGPTLAFKDVRFCLY